MPRKLTQAEREVLLSLALRSTQLANGWMLEFLTGRARSVTKTPAHRRAFRALARRLRNEAKNG